MVNLLPEDIGSRVIFEEIQDNYGLTEYMYVAIGNDNQSMFSENEFTPEGQVGTQEKLLMINI